MTPWRIDIRHPAPHPGYSSHGGLIRPNGCSTTINHPNAPHIASAGAALNPHRYAVPPTPTQSEPRAPGERRRGCAAETMTLRDRRPEETLPLHPYHSPEVGSSRHGPDHDLRISRYAHRARTLASGADGRDTSEPARPIPSPCLALSRRMSDASSPWCGGGWIGACSAVLCRVRFAACRAGTGR